MNEKISNYQLTMFIVLTILGVGIFSLPRVVAEATNSDGWITTILGGMIAIGEYYIISKLARKFPNFTFVEIAKEVVGKVLAIPIIFVFLLNTIIVSSMVLRIFGEVIKMSLLFKTPIEVILISFLLLAFLLARGGIEPIVRFDEFVFPIMIFSVILLLALAIPDSDFTNILPIMRTKPMDFINGVMETSFAYTDFEFVLFIVPFIKNREKIFKSGFIAILIVVAVYVGIVILSFAKLGVESVKHTMWPTLSMIRSINVPDSFIERLEGIIMPLWILFAFTTIAPSLYVLSKIISKTINHKEFKHFCTMLIPIVYIIAITPNSVVDAYKLLNFTVKYIGSISVFVIPILLYTVASIRKMGEKQNA